MDKEEDLLYYDFQGWPVYKKTFRELLERLNAVQENNILGFKVDDPKLDAYCCSYVDDGMAYGVDRMEICDIDFSIIKGEPTIKFWRDTKDEENIKRANKAIEEINQKLKNK